MSSDALTARLTVTQLVETFEQAERDVRAAFALLAAAEERLNATFVLAGWDTIRVRGAHRAHNGLPNLDEALAELRRDVWRSLADRLEVRAMMSVARWEEFQREIEKGEPPPISLESVRAWVTGLSANVETMLAEKVGEVFEWLRPRGEAAKLKTNSQEEVPAKVILPWIVDRWDLITTSWRVDYRADQRLIALESVFSALDGKGPIVKSAYSAIATAIKAPGFDGTGEVPYFRFRCFRNGRLHLWFTRPDLLARFNAIAGGKRLRAA